WSSDVCSSDLEADQDSTDREQQLRTDPLVVGSAVKERILQVRPKLRTDIGGRRHGGLPARGRRAAHQRRVFGINGGSGSHWQRRHKPNRQDHKKKDHGQHPCPPPQRSIHCSPPANLKAVHVRLRRSGIKAFAHYHYLLLGARHGHVQFLHQTRGIGREEYLACHRRIVDVPLDLPPTLHLCQDPHREGFVWERIEVDTMWILLYLSQTISVRAGQDLLHHRH